MQLTVKLNLLNYFATVSLEGSPEVMQFQPGQLSHHPVRDAAGHLPQQPVIASSVAPAAYQVIAFLDFFEKARNLLRIVLQIPIHRNNHFSPREIESSLQCRGLPKIAPQPHQIHAAIMLINVGEHLEGIIPAAVVDKN